MKTKKIKKTKLSKKERLAKKAAALAKKKARKGDGTFPDILVVTRERDNSGEKTKYWFLGHGEELDTLYKNGQVAAVYKLRRVSTVSIARKIVR